MTPAGLQHTDPGILKIGNRFHQKVRIGDKISVKNSQQRTFGGFKPLFQCTGFKATAVCPIDISNINTCGFHFCDHGSGNLHGIIG